MKIYKKSELEYKNGYLVKDNEVICIPNEIVFAANQLEKDVQRAIFKRNNSIQLKEPEKFVFKSERHKYPTVYADTPELDRAVEKAEAIMSELDDMAQAERATDYARDIQPLIDFVRNEEFVEADQPHQFQFDCATLGNPLELTDDDVLGFIIDAVE